MAVFILQISRLHLYGEAAELDTHVSQATA